MMTVYLERNVDALENARRFAEDGAIHTKECDHAWQAFRKFKCTYKDQYLTLSLKWLIIKVALAATTFSSIIRTCINPTFGAALLTLGLCVASIKVHAGTRDDKWIFAKLGGKKAVLEKMLQARMQDVDAIYNSIHSAFLDAYIQGNLPENREKYQKVRSYAAEILAKLPQPDPESDSAPQEIEWSQHTPALRSICQKIAQAIQSN
jgi:hypothetical protein